MRVAMILLAEKWKYEADKDRGIAKQVDSRESSLLYSGITHGKLEAAIDLLRFLETGRVELQVDVPERNISVGEVEGGENE